MIDTIGRIEELEMDTRSRKTMLARLEAEIAELEHELAPFRARYDRIIQPVVERLEAARSAVAEMEHYHRLAWINDERPVTPQPEPGAPAKTIPAGSLQPTADAVTNPRQSRLRCLYRKLVRCLHPDLASDAEEKSSRNQVLALINDAYARRDMTTLEVLTTLTAGDNPQAGAGHPWPTSAVQLWRRLDLYQLEQTHARLVARVEALTQRRDSLLHSRLMDLKIKAESAQRQARDLLREIAGSMEKEYQDYMARLERLQPRPGVSDRGKVYPGLKGDGPVSPSLLLHVSFVGLNEEIIVSLNAQEQIVLGRGAPAASQVLLDLTPFGAHELGVSRKHAAIVIRGLRQAYDDMWITDLESANGTYLNGQRLTPQAPCRLGNRDEIRLGYLRIRVRCDEAQAPFLERIRLCNPCSKSSWETNQQTWAEVLELATTFGCRSAQVAGDGISGSGARGSDENARSLADALERALPHLLDEPPRLVARCLDSPRIVPPVWYFGGHAGKRKIRDLIAFCRQGAFTVEVCCTAASTGRKTMHT